MPRSRCMPLALHCSQGATDSFCNVAAVASPPDVNESPRGSGRHGNLDSIIQVIGGFNPSEKYLSNGIIVPNIWKNKKCTKPPTSQL